MSNMTEITPSVANEVVENQTDKQVKYKKPYTITPKRAEAIKRMMEGRKKSIQNKKTTTESRQEALEKQLLQLQEQLAEVKHKNTPPDSEITITKPVPVEKEHKKKDKSSFEEVKVEMAKMRMMMEGLMPNQPVQPSAQIIKQAPVSTQPTKRSLYGIEF